MEKTLECDNVNGAMLRLKIAIKQGSLNSRLFTISYKSKENKSLPKISLFFALMFHFIALSFVGISVKVTAVIIIVLPLLFFFWITHSVESESVLVIPTVGIQSSIKYYFNDREDNFIPWSHVDDVIINEVIKLNRVLFYLTVLVKNLNQESESIKLVPLFKYTKPRLMMLETIYSEMQGPLTEKHNQKS